MRILVLSSSTGGGHDMRARSIEAWSAQLGDTVVHRYQALEESAGLYRFGVELYNTIQKKCPRLHHLYFNWLELFQISASEKLLLGKEKFITKLKEIRPDVIISVHAHTNHAFRSIARKTLPDVRFATYCGEMHGGYGFSRHWVDPQADAFIGATAEICQAAIYHGMPEEKTFNGGFMLNPKFYAPPLTKEEIERYRLDTLGINPDRFTLLLSTGANGAQNHFELIKATPDLSEKIQIIALCGSNQAAAVQLQSQVDGLRIKNVKVLGYQDDMLALMQSCDAIVARPGTGTTSEAILAGCPIIFNTLGGIMPQESITIKYLCARDLPIYRIHKPSDLATVLSPLTTTTEACTVYKKQLESLRPVNQPTDIFEYLKALV